MQPGILNHSTGVVAVLPEAMPTGNVSVNVSGGNISQAIGALAVLGYTPDEVMPFMSGVTGDMTVEQIISATLRAIGKRG